MEDRDPVVEEVRENFTLKRLQERVWRLEAENKELKQGNSILDTQYKSQCETQSDMLRQLYGELEENLCKVEDREATIERLEKEIEDQRMKHQEQLESERSVWENTENGLQKRVEALEGELHELREFKENKIQLEADLDKLEKQLQQQSEEFSQRSSDFDRKKVLEIDQIKKDTQRIIKETREKLKAKTKDQLDTTTKRVIMENNQYENELNYQSKEMERLMENERRLLEQNAQLRRNLSIHKDLENELARRTHGYQKLIKKMEQKQKHDADVRGEEHLASMDSFGDVSEMRSIAGGTTVQDLSVEAAALGEENDKLRRQAEGVQGTLQMVRHEFAQYRRDHATLTQLQDQSTRLIISALYELKNQRECDPFPPATYDQEADWAFATMTPKQKEYFFRVLLEKLNSSMCSSCFPTGPQPTSQSTSSLLPQISKASRGGQEAPQFSQFLWSVASNANGLGSPGSKRRDVTHKEAQTETDASDPCLKEGLWSPKARSFHGGAPVTPAMVAGSVRQWGPRAASHRSRLGRVV